MFFRNSSKIDSGSLLSSALEGRFVFDYVINVNIIHWLVMMHPMTADSERCDGIGPRSLIPGRHSRTEGVHPRPAQLFVGCQNRWNFQWDEEVAGKDIVVKVIERGRRMKLAGRDPSIRIGPLPAAG
jgi:hypothetical protein